MSETMSLVYLKETGSVLTYVTRRAVPLELQQIGTMEKEQQEALKVKELEAIVGTELVIRRAWNPTDADFKAAEFLIPAGELDALIIKVDANVVQDPQAYFINEEGETASVDNASVTMDDPPTTTQVTVTAPRYVPQPAKVWLRIQAQIGQDSRIAHGTIAAGSNAIVISFATLPAGKYLVLAAVTGFKPVVKKIAV